MAVATRTDRARGKRAGDGSAGSLTAQSAWGARHRAPSRSGATGSVTLRDTIALLRTLGTPIAPSRLRQRLLAIPDGEPERAPSAQ